MTGAQRYRHIASILAKLLKFAAGMSEAALRSLCARVADTVCTAPLKVLKLGPASDASTLGGGFVAGSLLPMLQARRCEMQPCFAAECLPEGLPSAGFWKHVHGAICDGTYRAHNHQVCRVDPTAVSCSSWAGTMHSGCGSCMGSGPRAAGARHPRCSA